MKRGASGAGSSLGYGFIIGWTIEEWVAPACPALLLCKVPKAKGIAGAHVWASVGLSWELGLGLGPLILGDNEGGWPLREPVGWGQEKLSGGIISLFLPGIAGARTS